MAGLKTDFSDDAIEARVLAKSSGLSPHERPGHATPAPLSVQEQSALRGEQALRQSDSADGIERT